MSQFDEAMAARAEILALFPKLAAAKDCLTKALEAAQNAPPHGVSDGSIDEIAFKQLTDVKFHSQHLLLALLFEPRVAARKLKWDDLATEKTP